MFKGALSQMESGWRSLFQITHCVDLCGRQLACIRFESTYTNHSFNLHMYKVNLRENVSPSRPRDSLCNYRLFARGSQAAGPYLELTVRSLEHIVYAFATVTARALVSGTDTLQEGCEWTEHKSPGNRYIRVCKEEKSNRMLGRLDE
jgi:hypothetical protein